MHVRVCVCVFHDWLCCVAAVKLQWSLLQSTECLIAVPGCWIGQVYFFREEILQTLTTLPSASQHATFPWTTAIHCQ